MWSIWKRRSGKKEPRPLEPVEGLSLYGYPQCPYCRRVFDAAASLGLEIPLRNTQQDPDHRRELVEALGRATVPALLIEGEAGDLKWLPESADIVRYLTERFGGEG
jgi:glutathione S-transferase